MVMVHRVTVTLTAAKVSSSEVGPLEGVRNRNLSCLIDAMKPSEAFEATGRTIHRPHLMICALADADNIGDQSVVRYGNRTFRVMGAPRLFDQRLPSDHAEFVLEELNYAAAEQ